MSKNRKNKDRVLLNKCRALGDYSAFVEKVYQYLRKCANIENKEERGTII